MKNIYIVIIVFLAVFNLEAQDPYFAQPLQSPLHFNPAMTGYIQGVHRLNLQHRAQWWEVAGRDAYQTTAISYDRRFCGDNTFAGGLQVLADQPFGNPMSNYQMHLSGSFHNQLGGLNSASASDGLFMAFGAQVGVLHYRLNDERMRFEDQFDPSISDFGTTLSQEIFAQDGVTTFDFNAGLLLYSTQSTFNYTFGFSIHHINTPRVIFLDGQFLDENQQELPIKWTAYGRLRFGFADRTSFMLEPTTFFQRQGKQWQWQGGLLLSREIISDQFTFSGGLSYRLASHWNTISNYDALIGQLIFDMPLLTVSLGYEANLSKLRTASNSIGGIELGVSVQFGEPNQCPRCPRMGGGNYPM